jgi:hypothetical protein
MESLPVGSRAPQINDLNAPRVDNTVPVPPANFPRQSGAPVMSLPIENEGPTPFYPPVCLKSHWDATAILKHSLPDRHVEQSLDFRPWTRICMEYTTAGPAEPGPSIAPSTVLPSGGQFYPASRYAAAIDQESALRRLDRPLGTCDDDQFEPNPNGDMYKSRILVPKGTVRSSAMVDEMSMPRALLRSGPYPCREQADEVNLGLSQLLFNNATKQDKYKLMATPEVYGAPAKSAFVAYSPRN